MDELLALGRLDSQALRAFKVTAAINDLHITLLSQHGDAAAELLHDGFLPFPKPRHVNARRFKVNATRGRLAGDRNAVHRVQQRLGGNAAAIEANSSQTLL